MCVCVYIYIYIYIYTSCEDDYFSVLHRDRDKFHLKYLEAVYIL